MGASGARQLDHPFSDEPVDDVPLDAAPLARVLAQLRFEQLSVLTSPSAAETFASELSESYPFLDRAVEFNMLIGGGGQVAPQATQSQVWRLRSADKRRVVTLSNGALSLEMSNYPGRRDFCAEFRRLADTLRRVTRVPSYSRLGIRYTNRVTEEAVIAELPSLIRPEILGVSSVQLGPHGALQHALSQASFSVRPDGGLLAQWGIMPPNTSFDPSLEAIPERSWVLDLDSYRQNVAIAADPENVEKEALELATRAYRFFRWAVSPTFLKQFGGTS